MKSFLLLFFSLLAGAANPVLSADPILPIIPQPAEVRFKTGTFSTAAGGTVNILSADSSFQKLASSFWFTGRVEAPSLDAPELIAVRVYGLPAEAYKLDISPLAIKVEASEPAGLFYAFQTLKQLFISTNGRVEIPAVQISDYPAFQYRGMHLDVSRHFYSLDYLKRYIDLLAFYKINRFHWHLTDSHGWRLEIKQFPKLTGVGAWRADRSGIPFVISPPTGKDEPKTYGGFYTQQEVKELIAYAADRYITIIPEIEMPGHCTAALVAYPEYTCLNNPVPLLIPTGYPGDLKHNFCPGYDSTFLFLQAVLDEVMDIFPSEYIHIGGDEVRPASWLGCPRCQKLMKAKGMSKPAELQAYFTEKIDRYISTKNRKLIGWDEIMEAGISPTAGVMSWRGKQGGIAAAKASHEVVMAPYRYVYFDFYQSPPELEPDISYAGLTVDSVYQFEPVPEELVGKEAEYILGGQACLWTENIRTTDRVEYMLLPRMLALSEAVWTPRKQKSYPGFVQKLEAHFGMLKQMRYNYSTSLYNVFIRPAFDSATQTVTIKLDDQVAGLYTIKYSLSEELKEYSGPFTINSSNIIRAGLYKGDTLLGKFSSDTFSIHKGFAKAIRNFAVQTALSPYIGKLVDGIHGTFEPYDGRWLHWADSVQEIDIDLGSLQKISGIKIRCLEDPVGNALLPALTEISLAKKKNRFRIIHTETEDGPRFKTRTIYQINKTAINKKARYLRIKLLTSTHSNPENPSPNRVFLDEIIVE